MSGGRGRISTKRLLPIAAAGAIRRYLALAALMALFAQACGSGLTPTPPVPASSSPMQAASLPVPSSTPSPSPSTTPTLSPGIWPRTNAPEGLGTPLFMAWLGERFVLFGPNGKIWSSPDGSSWTRLADLPGGSAWPTTVRDAIATGSGYLAVGMGESWASAAVWTSADGLAWQRVPDQAAFQGAAMEAVARGSSGFVAVGVVPRTLCSLGATCGLDGAIWRSADGRTWSRVAGTTFHTSILGVTAGPFGYVASGGDDWCEACAESGPRIWISADGKTWRLEDPKIATPEGPGWGGRIVKLAGSEIAIVSTPTSSGGGTGWSSTDGEHWRHLVFPSEAVVGGLPSGGLVAASMTAVGTSPDGRTWTTVGRLQLDPTTGAPFELACGPQRCVAIGYAGSDLEVSYMVMWTGSPEAAP